jgi:glutathione S-transferase
MLKLKLYGFALSNYFNKVKFVLLEHDIPFEEVFAYPHKDSSHYALSPLGKVPYIETEHGPLCESESIVEYLAAAYPDKRIFPADAYAAAKQRELITFVELHLELVARELYPEAFFNTDISDGTKQRVQRKLQRHIPAFKQLTKFAPYIAGDQFTLADIAAFVHLPVIGQATKAIYGTDYVLDAGIDWKAYLKVVGTRPAAQKVQAERKAFIEAQRAQQ